MSSPYNYSGYQPQHTQTQYGQMEPYNAYTPPVGVKQKSKVLAAVLFFVLGGLGVGNFYLGQTKRGVFTLLLSLFAGFCFLTILLIPLAYLIEGALFLAIVAQIIFVLTGSLGYDRDGDGVPLR
ncbi:TM2 domain-containing protein [Corynebacterium sp. Q4381]|uniref:TM2 domain-containing protein n=1 Tax=Corynebacterium sp. Marseille-Q4381 TaxID=3121597 RepID=UPI002FE58329